MNNVTVSPYLSVKLCNFQSSQRVLVAICNDICAVVKMWKITIMIPMLSKALMAQSTSPVSSSKLNSSKDLFVTSYHYSSILRYSISIWNTSCAAVEGVAGNASGSWGHQQHDLPYLHLPCTHWGAQTLSSYVSILPPYQHSLSGWQPSWD